MAENAFLSTLLVTKNAKVAILAALPMDPVADLLNEIPLGWIYSADPVDCEIAAPVADDLGTVEKPDSLKAGAVAVA